MSQEALQRGLDLAAKVLTLEIEAGRLMRHLGLRYAALHEIRDGDEVRLVFGYAEPPEGLSYRHRFAEVRLPEEAYFRLDKEDRRGVLDKLAAELKEQASAE